MIINSAHGRKSGHENYIRFHDVNNNASAAVV